MSCVLSTFVSESSVLAEWINSPSEELCSMNPRDCGSTGLWQSGKSGKPPNTWVSLWSSQGRWSLPSLNRCYTNYRAYQIISQPTWSSPRVSLSPSLLVPSQPSAPKIIFHKVNPPTNPPACSVTALRWMAPSSARRTGVTGVRVLLFAGDWLQEDYHSQAISSWSVTSWSLDIVLYRIGKNMFKNIAFHFKLYNTHFCLNRFWVKTKNAKMRIWWWTLL